MRRFLKSILCIVMASSFVLVGCSSKTEEEELKLIGEKISGDNVVEIELTNETGKEITGFSVKTGTMNNFGENMLKEDDSFAIDETRVLYYDMTDAIEENEEAQKDSEMETTPEYTLQITYGDDTVNELHNFPMEDIEKASLKMDEENAVTYVEYTSISTEEEVSTKEAEIKIKEDEKAKIEAEKKAQEEALAQQQAEEQAAQQASQQATQQQTTQQYTTPQQSQPVQNTPTNSGSSANDGCLGEDVDLW